MACDTEKFFFVHIPSNVGSAPCRHNNLTISENPWAPADNRQFPRCILDSGVGLSAARNAVKRYDTYDKCKSIRSATVGKSEISTIFV
jgi:hypothetical protein